MGKSTQPDGHLRHDSGCYPHSSGTLLEAWTQIGRKVQLRKGGTSLTVLPPPHPPYPVIQAASPGSWFPSFSDRGPTLFCSKAPGASPVGEMLTCPFKWLAGSVHPPIPAEILGFSMQEGMEPGRWQTLSGFSCPQYRQGCTIASLGGERVGSLLGESW